jgi:hypothetical protein
VDEPARWPFFTAREVRLHGSPGQEARWKGGSVRGAFQQLVAVEGEARIEGAWGRPEALAVDRPSFLPATLDGGYTLAAGSSARILIFGVPVP